MNEPHLRPEKLGLYDPAFEHESCGVGLVAHIKGEASRQIVADADYVLRSMSHRGACGCEANTGDGAGILTALPHRFLAKVAAQDLKVRLPSPGQYAAGIVFFPKGSAEQAHCRSVVEAIIRDHRQKLIGWRRVPTRADIAQLGKSALASEPHIEQLFIGAGDGLSDISFERMLYVIRKQITHKLENDANRNIAEPFYICTLSPKVIVYKGMLTSEQLFQYFPDLNDPDFTSHVAMVHSRFSTNTFPSWDRAHPMRAMCHNGEINTLKGNVNWMRARQSSAKTNSFGNNLAKVFPVVEPDRSDSGTFDNVLEFLLMSGRTLEESVMMMIPEAWQNHETMSDAKRAFYEFHSCLMEPWDGPACIVFSDGDHVGAVLDRNGLRPARYYRTDDDRVIMASEFGVLPVDPARVVEKGRLQPGRMFLIDFTKGRLIPDDEVKESLANGRPYREWLNRQRLDLAELKVPDKLPTIAPESLLKQMRAFGYTSETMDFMLIPLVQTKQDPLGSMGNDSALACLSEKPRLIYDYFRQAFAQVTNPPIDSIREEVVMSLECYIGPEGNLAETAERQCHRLRIPQPILSNAELAALKQIDVRGWRCKTIDTTFLRTDGRDGLVAALDRVCASAEAAIDEGFSLIVLSDRNMGAERVPLSSLLASGAVHHHLVRQQKRTRLGIIVETGEAREVHHHCLLIGFGADAINPYLAFAALEHAQQDGHLGGADYNTPEKITAAYKKGVSKGMLKVIAKMGISTLQSYKGAQIFEAIGLREEVIEKCFVGTASQVQGVGFTVLAEEALRRHAQGFPAEIVEAMTLPNHGEYHWRPLGERHIWDPEAIASLQVAAQTNSREAYERFARMCNEETGPRSTLRAMLRFKTEGSGKTVSLDEVEPAKEIVKRFCTGAMSFGSISAEAHETMALALNRLGGKSNTGEGGEDPIRYSPLADGSSKRSAIKQVASGRFGVTIEYLSNADELQIKIAQGAKPGEGGELPGRKVDETIARIRYSTPGVGLISPPPHHDIYSIEDLKQLIHDLKSANPRARVSVKLVGTVGVGTIAAGVAKCYADHILISGAAGGTGASPLTSIKHAGSPWELGLAETHQTLVLNDLRSRVVLQTDGGLRTGRDVIIAALLGAEEFGFSTAPLIALGCIMMRKCHLNTCPVGIATQDPELRAKFAGQPEHVLNYFFLLAEDMRQIMARLGFKTVQEMIGRVDVLEVSALPDHWKAKGIDVTSLLTPAKRPHEGVQVFCTQKQDHGLALRLDQKLIQLCRPALERSEKVYLQIPIRNTDRSVGTLLSNAVAAKPRDQALPDHTIQIKFTGSAGNSFGAFLSRGLTFELEGDANDYVGKGLSGGRLALYPPRTSSFRADENILVGNVVLYGATGGEAYICGRAAERFCVRNSGARAVVEGVGDHGCEYMTGGRVVVLGETGRNFAAGMSGGIAYVWDRSGNFSRNCNPGMVEIEELNDIDEIEEVWAMIECHFRLTRSTLAERLLTKWEQLVPQFVKVMPVDYKRVLKTAKTKRAHIALPGDTTIPAVVTNA